MLGDLLIKTNRHEEAGAEYTNALNFTNPDPHVLNKVISSTFNAS